MKTRFPTGRGFSTVALAVVASGGLVFATAEVLAENWPQWRGPSSHGVSSESNLPTTWSAKENLAWKTTLAGLGTSSPIVWNDRVFATSQIGRVPVAGGGGHPQLARDDRALASQENPIGGRRVEADRNGGEVWLVVEAFRRSDGTRLWEYRTRATGPLPEVHEKHNLATPISRKRISNGMPRPGHPTSRRSSTMTACSI